METSDKKDSNNILDFFLWVLLQTLLFWPGILNTSSSIKLVSIPGNHIIRIGRILTSHFHLRLISKAASSKWQSEIPISLSKFK